MRRCLLCLLLLSLVSVAAMAQLIANPPSVHLRGRSFSDLQAGQRMLLSNYCRLDFEGARLHEDGWSRFKPYSTLRTNPEFARIMVVTRFDIELPEQPSAVIGVRYQTVGSYDDTEGYTAHTEGSRVDFRIRELEGELMVTEIAPTTPHVSARAAIAWMQKRLADPKTSELEQAHLRDALAQLNRLAQPRPAAQ
jgi:opacity protein-like surface antigen